MAVVSIRPEVPNILIVSGIDVYTPGTIRGLTKAALDAALDQPVHAGTHEFWILHPIPDFPGQASNFTQEGDNGSPRPRRGIIQMIQALDPLTETLITTYLSTLLQEVGHHWLFSPTDIQLRISGTPTRMATRDELTNAINDDTPFQNPPLLARDENHWSAYWRADGSPMDGVCFRPAGSEDGHELWRTGDCGEPISLDFATPNVRLNGFCDLDLHLMGLKTAQEAYRGEAGIVWMQPRITEFVESHAGIVVAFARDDQLMFGFWQHDRQLNLRDSSGQVLGSGLVTPNYHPFAHAMNGLLFRVIRRRNTYYFQARISNPSAGCLGGLLQVLGVWDGGLPNVWDDVDAPIPLNATTNVNANYQQNWVTVGIAQRSKPPVAVGAFLNKWVNPHLTDAAFYRFEMKEGATRWSMRTDSVPPVMTGGDYASLVRGELRREESDGALFRVKNKRLHIVAPYGRVRADKVVDLLPDERFRHRVVAGSDPEDNSLKVLTPAPPGDFAFATHAKLHRTILTPWAGGVANDKEVFGTVSRAAAADVVLSQASLDRQAMPPARTFRMVFIAVAPDAAAIPLQALQRLDTLRRYWEVAFRSATEGRLTADTSLVSPPVLEQ